MINVNLFSEILANFPREKFDRLVQKQAVKLHTVLDYDGCLPVFAQLTDGNIHEISSYSPVVTPASGFRRAGLFPK